MGDDKSGQCAHGYYGLCPHCYDSLRAANARLQAWHDAVVAARVVDAVDVGTAAMVLRQANGRILELQDAVDEIERRSVKAIIRPQPLAKE